jgi:hypothetical protein
VVIGAQNSGSAGGVVRHQRKGPPVYRATAAARVNAGTGTGTVIMAVIRR